MSLGKKNKDACLIPGSEINGVMNATRLPKLSLIEPTPSLYSPSPNSPPPPPLRNSNHLIQIRITVPSGRPQIVALDFVVVAIPYQTSTLQCEKV